MKLEEYLKELNKLVKENPELLEAEVITSIDDEGNGFNRVFYTANPGFFEDGEFIGESNEEKPPVINAVCLN